MLQINNINITYNNRKIIKNSNFICNDTGITIIKGKSGSGKTSLIRNILYQEHFFEEYIYNNQKISSPKKLINIFSFMNQTNTFIENLTISDHFKLMKNLYHKQDINNYLIQLELVSTLNKYPNQLSGGEKNRISFLLCILKDAPIIILDEPTAALDTYFTDVIKKIIKKKSNNHLFIIASHDKSLFDIADSIYEINNQKLYLTKNNKTNTVAIPLSKKQKLFLPIIFFKMKKHHLTQNIIMMILLSFSIVITSLSVSYSFSSLNNHYDELENLVNNEIIVYKPLFNFAKNFFSGCGNENYINETEIELLKNLNHVKNMTPHIELVFSSIYQNPSNPFENYNLEYYNKIDNFELYNDNQTILTSTFKEITQSEMTFINYNSIDPKQIETKYCNEGIYLSKDIAESMNLDKKGDYELSFLLPIPQYIIIGDGEMQLADDPTYYPVSYVTSQAKKIRIKIAGILKGNSGCAWSKQTNCSIFIPNEYYIDLINQNIPKNALTYYYDKTISQDGIFTTDLIENHEISNICYSIPWQANAYKIQVDSIENYENTVKKIENLGFATISNKTNFASINNIAYRTSDSFIKFAITLIIIITLINLLLKFINSYKEKSLNKFFEELGYQKYKLNLLFIQKYLVDTVIIVLLSLIICLVFQYICIQINYVIAPITVNTILSILFLTILIEFIFPIILGGVNRAKTRKY